KGIEQEPGTLQTPSKKAGSRSPNVSDFGLRISFGSRISDSRISDSRIWSKLFKFPFDFRQSWAIISRIPSHNGELYGVRCLFWRKNMNMFGLKGRFPLLQRMQPICVLFFLCSGALALKAAPITSVARVLV